MIIKFIGRIIIGLLWIRAVLVLVGVAAKGIIGTLYNITGILIDPFVGIFPNYVLLNRFTLEFTTLLAIVVYALIEFILIKVFSGRHDDE